MTWSPIAGIDDDDTVQAMYVARVVRALGAIASRDNYRQSSANFGTSRALQISSRGEAVQRSAECGSVCTVDRAAVGA